MKFIQLTEANPPATKNPEIWVNLDLIADFQIESGSTHLRWEGGVICVVETPDQILARINS